MLIMSKSSNSDVMVHWYSLENTSTSMQHSEKVKTRKVKVKLLEKKFNP